MIGKGKGIPRMPIHSLELAWLWRTPRGGSDSGWRKQEKTGVCRGNRRCRCANNCYGACSWCKRRGSNGGTGIVCDNGRVAVVRPSILTLFTLTAMAIVSLILKILVVVFFKRYLFQFAYHTGSLPSVSCRTGRRHGRCTDGANDIDVDLDVITKKRLLYVCVRDVTVKQGTWCELAPGTIALLLSATAGACMIRTKAFIRSASLAFLLFVKE